MTTAKSQLHIAMLAPLKRALTATVTASRPRVMVDLITELQRRGHNITVFGTGDSELSGVTIVPVIPVALTKLPPPENSFYQHTAALTKQMELIIRRQQDFSLIHNHMYPEYLIFPADHAIRVPMVTTIHSQMTDDMKSTLALYPSQTMIAISHSAAADSGLPIPTIYNGIDTNVFVPKKDATRDYFLFVGRMSKAVDENGKFLDPKGVLNAIQAAKKAGMKLKIVGNVETPTFYTEYIKPFLGADIEYVGEVSAEQHISRKDMVSLFQHAKALLNPINWREPFGLVMAEAMSCGTPVIAYDRGSVSELVLDGSTGYIVNPTASDTRSYTVLQQGIEGLVEAMGRVEEIDGTVCRKHIVDHFSVTHMADAYIKVYEELLRTGPSRP